MSRKSIHGFASATTLMGMFAASLHCTAGPASAQSVPGFEVELFATPPFPQLLAFDDAGVLFAGRDDIPSGSATPNFVTKIEPNGASGPYGLTAIPDPDALVIDIDGAVSGIPGAVLVGGLVTLSGPGRVSTIAPDGTVATLFEDPSYGNISELKIDGSGRLYFVSVDMNKTFVSEGGGMPTMLFATGTSPIYLTIGPDNRIYTSDSNGTVRVNESNGTLVDASFADFDGRVSIEFAASAGFGDDLLALESSSGNLYTVDQAGTKSLIGTGFEGCDDLAVGPCGVICLSCRLASKVFRIRRTPSPDINGDGHVNGADLALVLGTWNEASCATDLNQDGTVNGADLAIVLGSWGPVTM